MPNQDPNINIQLALAAAAAVVVLILGAAIFCLGRKKDHSKRWPSIQDYETDKIHDNE